jgi:hypothetical protein
MDAKQKFMVTTYFTYSVTVEVEAENENQAWIEGRKQAIDTPMEDMVFGGTNDTIVMDEEFNILLEE